MQSCSTAMLVDCGAVTADLQPLIQAVADIPLAAWEYRSDPESDKTCVVREGTRYFPRTEVESVLDAVGYEEFGRGYYNRVVLSCVPAGQQILPHTDDFGAAGEASYHCHIPLVTHPDVVMVGPDGEAHMETGHLYVMDATQRHSVKNPSPVDRVHLLFAYFPEAGKAI